MERVAYGTSGLMVGRLGLGCMSMSGTYGKGDDAESIRTIHRALDLGVTLLDTSVSYGTGHNQELIGKALKGRRSAAIVHSKFGARRGPKGEPMPHATDPKSVRSDCEDSLRRFGFDYIDVWCPSRMPDPATVPDTIGAMAQLQKEGKIRHLALSEVTPEVIGIANRVHPTVSLQYEYSLFARDIERGPLAAARAHKMAVMAYSPVVRGMFARAVTDRDLLGEGDARRRQAWFQPGNLEANLKLVAQVEDMARSKGCSASRIALAWILSRGSDIIPIPSSKSIAHLEDNLAAAELQLSAAELAQLDAIFKPGAVQGERGAAARAAERAGAAKGAP